MNELREDNTNFEGDDNILMGKDDFSSRVERLSGDYSIYKDSSVVTKKFIIMFAENPLTLHSMEELSQYVNYDYLKVKIGDINKKLEEYDLKAWNLPTQGYLLGAINPGEKPFEIVRPDLKSIQDSHPDLYQQFSTVTVGGDSLTNGFNPAQERLIVALAEKGDWIDKRKIIEELLQDEYDLENDYNNASLRLNNIKSRAMKKLEGYEIVFKNNGAQICLRRVDRKRD